MSTTTLLRRNKSKRFRDQSYKRLVKLQNDIDLPFSDCEFRQQNQSVFETSSYKSRLDIGRVSWKRPKEMVEDVEAKSEFRLLPPKSSQTLFCADGPNQWFIAACMAISQHRSLLQALIQNETDNFSKYGIAKFSIWQFGIKYKVVVDDKLPTSDSKLIFTHAPGGAVPEFWWASLLEKAYAKLYGSYESLAVKSSLTSALIDFTNGGVVDKISLDSIELEDCWDLICKEIASKSLLLLKTKENMSNDNLFDLASDRYYLLRNVKRTMGTLKKISLSPSKSQEESFSILNTIYDSTKSSRTTTKPSEMWMTNSFLKRSFQSLIICAPYASNVKRIHRQVVDNGGSGVQMCFDVINTTGHIVINFVQRSNINYTTLGFRLYSIELNREFKVHDFSKLTLVFSLDPIKQRNVIQRLALPYGRYLISTICTSNVPMLVSILSAQVSHFVQLNLDMPRYQLLPMLQPTYPSCVSRVIVHGAEQLDQQDRFGSANIYCIIRYGRKVVKSSCAQETLTPKWDNFSSIIYHRNLEPIQIELWHRSLLMDFTIGSITLLPKINCSDEMPFEAKVETKQLMDKKNLQTRPGLVHYELYTSENLKYF